MICLHLRILLYKSYPIQDNIYICHISYIYICIHAHVYNIYSKAFPMLNSLRMPIGASETINPKFLKL